MIYEWPEAAWRQTGLSGHVTELFMKEPMSSARLQMVQRRFFSQLLVAQFHNIKLRLWPTIKTILSHTNRLQFTAAAQEPVFNITPVLLPSGKRAEQTRDVATAHPEPFWNLPERQQERQLHPVRPLRGSVSGERLAAPAERNQHTQGCIRRKHYYAVGARHPTFAFTGHGDQKSQKEKAGACQWEDQELARVFEEPKPRKDQLKTPEYFMDCL